MDAALFTLLLVFAAYAGLTLGTGYLAERKGRSFAAWAALGFFLGIFGLLLAAIVPARRPSHEDIA